MTPHKAPVISVDTTIGYDRFYRQFKWQVPETFNFGNDVVDRIARDHDGPALIWENVNGDQRRFSYSQIAVLTDRFANVLQAKGVKKGDFVIVMLPRIPEWQIAMVALLKLGAVPIPCIEMLTEHDLTYRLENSGAVGVICRAEHVEKFRFTRDLLSCRIVIGEASGWSSYDAEMAVASEVRDLVEVRAEDPAVMYYTSGSTGHPKGVLHAARALYAWWVSAGYWLDLNPGDTIWCTADTGWSKAGTSILFGPWSRGACSFFFDGPFDAKARLKLLEKHKISVFCAPTTELFRLLDERLDEYDLSSLRRTVSAGESVSPVICNRWRATTGMDVSEAYGQTEALMLVLNYPCDEVRPGSMGRPSPGSVIDVIGVDGARLADDQEGDVAVLMPNPQMMLGYWHDEERTAASFKDGPDGQWYITGDRGRRDAMGYIWYAGRNDDVINSSGYRIGPMELENVLLEHPAVLECAVIGKPDAKRGEIVKAFVVLRDGHAADSRMVEELQNHSKRMTAPYKYPREIDFVNSLPKTLTGKIRRSELRGREQG